MSELELTTLVNAPPSMVWETWMNAGKLEAVLGPVVEVQPQVGGQFSLWEGSVRGEFVFLRRFDLIVMTWRTEDFEYGDPDSRLEMSFKEMPQGTLVRVVQDQIPTRLKNQFVMAWNDVVFPAMQRKIKGLTLR